MSATVLIEFDDVAEHTFDSEKLTLLNDKGQLKNQVSANEIFFANFDGLGDGSGGSPVTLSRRGGKTIVFGGVTNTGQVAGGVLDFPNQDRSLATYANITEILTDFAFRSKIHSNVATVASDRFLIRLVSNVDNSQVQVLLSNQGGGITRLKLKIIDSAGAVTSDTILILKDLSLDPDFEIAFSNDDNGNTLAWVDGVLKSTVASPNFNFTDCDMIFGDDDASKTSVADYDDVQLFNADEITVAPAFPFGEPTTYVLLEQVMLTNVPLIVDEIVSVASIHTIPADTQLKFFITLDGQAFWYDGANWVISNQTLAEANTLAEIQANTDSIPVTKGIGKILQLGTIFESDFGYATSLVENITIGYKMAFKSDTVTLCTVFGTILDNSGKAVVGAIVRVQSDDKFFNNVVIGPSAKAITNDQGKFSISVPETATANTPVDFFIEYTEKQLDGDSLEVDVPIIFEYLSRIVPNAATAELASLDEAT